MATASDARRTPPPHAPHPSLLARALGPFKVTGIFWYRFHHWGVRVGPDWLKRLLVPAFTLGFFLSLWRIGRAIAANLEAVLGPAGLFETWRRVFRTELEFAWCLTERYERLNGVGEIVPELDGEERWQPLTESERGFIVVTAHVGNWEVGSFLPAPVYHRDVHLIREPEMDPRAQAFVERALAASGGGRYTTHFASDDPALGLQLYEGLQRGDIVALQADRPRARGRTIAVELFGRPFTLPKGPLALARLSGAPICPVFVYRTGRFRYRIRFDPLIEVPRTASRDDDFRDAADRLARSLEEAIRFRPHQWFCFHRLWN